MSECPVMAPVSPRQKSRYVNPSTSVKCAPLASLTKTGCGLAQRAIQFVRSTPGIGTALVGMKTPAHVDENLGAAAVSPMPWDRFKRLFNEV